MQAAEAERNRVYHAARAVHLAASDIHTGQRT